MNTRQILSSLFAILALSLCGPFLAAAEVAQPKPNILFIICDDLIPTLGCYGNATVKSPNIDRLAARGVRFDRAYCQYPLCNPSRVSFLSGRRPETSGIYVLNKSARAALPDAVMLPQYFRERGYFTAGAGKVFHSGKMNDPKSWDFYEDGDGNDPQEKAAIKARYGSGNESKPGGEGDGRPAWYVLDSDGSQTRDGINAQTICRLIAEKNAAGKPFFLAAGFHKPHLPWTAPKRFFDWYPDGAITVPAEPAMIDIPPIALQTELSGFGQPSSRTGAIRGYYACVSFTDHQVGLLLDQLDRLDLWNNTVVVLLGDNGFHLGDHGGLWAKLSAFDASTRVPLIFAGAGVPAGRTATTPVELLDIYPTLLDLCGQKISPELEGRSLVPMMRGTKKTAPRIAHSMVFHYDAMAQRDVLSRSAIAAQWRYTEWYGGASGRELYWRTNDPTEYHNRAADPALSDTLRAGQQALQQFPAPKPGPANRPRALLFPPRVFRREAADLLAARASLARGEPALQPALAALYAEAARALDMRPSSVMDKTLTAASGDKHDYFTFGPYWWPDPASSNGLPYIRRDGELNPASTNGTDTATFNQLCDNTETLCLAYWLTGDERYAQKAARLARVWFFDPATRMNPNLDYGQAIPGVTEGRGIGLIDFRRLADINENLALLTGSPAWTDHDRAALKSWLSDFYHWLTTSAIALDEHAAKNNHGTWYDAQTAHLALILDRRDDAKKLLSEGLTNRLALQIERDGSQPLELARTKSMSYSLFNLEGLFTCAQLASKVGVDWWSYTTADGRSLHAALAYLAPYADPAKIWPKKDLHAAEQNRLIPLLNEYLRQHDDFALRNLANRFANTSPADARWRLICNQPLTPELPRPK